MNTQCNAIYVFKKPYKNIIYAVFIGSYPFDNGCYENYCYRYFSKSECFVFPNANWIEKNENLKMTASQPFGTRISLYL